MAVSTRGSSRTPIRSARRTSPRRSRRPSSGSPFQAPVVALIIAVPLALGLFLVVLFQAVFSGRIYPGVSALGVALGGSTEQAAADRLTEHTARLASTTVTLTLGDQQWRANAHDLGVQSESGPLADAAYQVGREGSLPTRLGAQFTALLHGTDVALSDEGPNAGALDGFLKTLAGQVNRPVQEAHLAVKPDFSLDYRGGQQGRSLDTAALAPALRAALATGGTLDLAPYVKTVSPKTTEAQLSDAREAAEHILATPLTLTFEDQKWTIERDTLARMLSFESPDGKQWAAKIDDAPLKSKLTEIAGELEQAPKDARLSWDDGALGVLRPSAEGRHLDVDKALAAADAALKSDNHTVELPVEVAKPAVDEHDTATLGITELIDSASTTFAGSVPEKRTNIQLAAKLLNGVVVAPGETFSFNKEVGPTTLEAGFKWGYGLEAGPNGVKTVPSEGGGICQVATTLFQPVFWSGYQIEERNWHLYWIPHYTSHGLPGLDATVDEAAGLDFKFTNTTSTALLIQSWADDSDVSFALYGTKPNWTVDVPDPEITNKRPADPKMHYQAQPDKPWGWRLLLSEAREGFDVKFVRTVTVPGQEPRVLKLSSSYQPSQSVTLVGTQGAPDGVSLEPPAAPGSDVVAAPTPKPAGTPGPEGAAGADATPGPAATAPPAKPTPADDGASQQATPVAPAEPAAEPPAAKPTAAPAQPTAAAPEQPPANAAGEAGQPEVHKARPTMPSNG